MYLLHNFCSAKNCSARPAGQSQNLKNPPVGKKELCIMPSVVFRVAKIKTAGNLAGALSHMQRTRPTANANLNISNIVIKRPTGNIEQIMNDIKNLNGGQLRKGGVIASDIVISASPEYFRPDDLGKAGFYEPEKLNKWRLVMEPWIEKMFPHSIAVELHLDESTPHYTILDLPFNEKTGKLSHREKFGGDSRLSLSKWQDLAAEPVARLGIKRGTAGSQAEHTDIDYFYSHTKLPTISFKSLPPPVIPGILKRSENDLNDFAVEQRNLVLDQVRPLYMAALAKGKAYDALEKENKNQKKTINQQNANIEILRNEADRLRELPIDDVLKKIYSAELERGSKESHESRKYELGDGRKVGVSKGNLGADVWILQGENGKRGAINLVMQLDSVNYKGALNILSNYFSNKILIREIAASTERNAVDQIDTIKSMPTPVPLPDPEKWPKVSRYLHEVRFLPKKIIDFLYKKRLVFADSNANAVFPRENGGAYVRGTTLKPFFRAFGSKAMGAYVIPGTGDCWLCESPIDAASIKAIHAEAHVICIGGSMLNVNEINAPQGRKIVLGFDNDEAGQLLTKKALERWSSAIIAKPLFKDWNETLQKNNDLIDAAWLDDHEISTKIPSLTLPKL